MRSYILILETLFVISLASFTAVTASKLKQSCSSNTDCEEVEYSECAISSGNFCQCKASYKPKPENPEGECVEVLGSQCNSESDCAQTPGIICDSGYCVCKNGYLPDTRQCVIFSGGECQEAAQCKSIMGDFAECKDRQCICEDGYHRYSQQCIKTKRLNEECQSDKECYQKVGVDNTLKCEGGKCTCVKPFVAVGDKCSGASALWGLSFAAMTVISAVIQIYV